MKIVATSYPTASSLVCRLHVKDGWLKQKNAVLYSFTYYFSVFCIAWSWWPVLDFCNLLRVSRWIDHYVSDALLVIFPHLHVRVSDHWQSDLRACNETPLVILKTSQVLSLNIINYSEISKIKARHSVACLYLPKHETHNDVLDHHFHRFVEVDGRLVWVHIDVLREKRLYFVFFTSLRLCPLVLSKAWSLTYIFHVWASVVVVIFVISSCCSGFVLNYLCFLFLNSRLSRWEATLLLSPRRR